MGFNKLVVIKRLKSPDDDGHVKMFLDEARLAARLNHPNIVHTYEVGETDGKYFIAMEYLEGQSLQALLTCLAARREGLERAARRVHRRAGAQGPPPRARALRLRRHAARRSSTATCRRRTSI